jgi:hypothetical protein
MFASSEPVAGDGIADRQREEGEADDEHEQIEHGNSLQIMWSFDADRPDDIRKRYEFSGPQIKTA